MRRFRYLAAAMAITGLLTGSATAASAATSQPARAHAAAAVHLRSGATAGHHRTRHRGGAADQWHRAARDLARQPVGAVSRQRPGSAVHVPGDGGPGHPQPDRRHDRSPRRDPVS